MPQLRGENNTIRANIVSGENVIKSKMTNIPSATTDIKGLIRIATDEEALAGELNNVAITPHTLSICTNTFIFEQGIASRVWNITHTLTKKRPSTTFVDSAGTVQVPNEINYIDDHTIEAEFLSEFAGFAYLN